MLLCVTHCPKRPEPIWSKKSMIGGRRSISSNGFSVEDKWRSEVSPISTATPSSCRDLGLAWLVECSNPTNSGTSHVPLGALSVTAPLTKKSTHSNDSCIAWMKKTSKIGQDAWLLVISVCSRSGLPFTMESNGIFCSYLGSSSIKQILISVKLGGLKTQSFSSYNSQFLMGFGT